VSSVYSNLSQRSRRTILEYSSPEARNTCTDWRLARTCEELVSLKSSGSSNKLNIISSAQNSVEFRKCCWLALFIVARDLWSCSRLPALRKKWRFYLSWSGGSFACTNESQRI